MFSRSRPSSRDFTAANSKFKTCSCFYSLTKVTKSKTTKRTCKDNTSHLLSVDYFLEFIVNTNARTVIQKKN